MSRRAMQRPQQHRYPTSDSSTFSKLKHWFNKGAEIQSDNKVSHQAKQDQQQDMGSAPWTASRQIHTADGATRRRGLLSPLGPRQLPQAVHAEVRNDRCESDNVSIFSSLRSTSSTSLTISQSNQPSTQTQRTKASKGNLGGVQISLPQPRESLLNLASGYADVQNPKTVFGANKETTPAAKVKSSYSNKDEQRYRPDRPIKEVQKTRGQVITPPAYQRSHKAVVRKMEPQQALKADKHVRHVYRETRFEDFMGKGSPPPVPSLPASSGRLAPSTSTDSRLSRPFAGPSEHEDDNDARPGTASTAALSRSDSRAQTWLRYDRKHREAAQQDTNSPLFPRRNLTVPDRDQQFKYTPCQLCRTQMHPSTAVNYNGIYLCERCAAIRPQDEAVQKEHAEPQRYNIPRKPVPTTARMPFAASDIPADTLSTSTTLGNTPSPQFSPRQSRTRRKDVPPGYEYLQTPKPSTPPPTSAPLASLTPSPVNPYFATADAQGRYPRYRTPPPPPINTTITFSDSDLLSPPSTSPLRKAHPASSIYPSTPWRLSRPPSMPPIIPEAYNFEGKAKVKERDTVYRAEVEEDIIDSYAADSPVSPLSGGEAEYMNAGWRGRR